MHISKGGSRSPSPVSVFGSVADSTDERWARGRGGGRRRRPGQCAGAGALGSSWAHAVTSAGGPSQAGSMAGMGDPPPILPTYPYRAGQWHGWQGREGSVYPVAPLLGPGRGGRTAAPRKNGRRHARSGCSYSLRGDGRTPRAGCPEKGRRIRRKEFNSWNLRRVPFSQKWYPIWYPAKKRG